MGRWDAISDYDYDAQTQPDLRRVDLTCRRCGHTFGWPIRYGPPPNPVRCPSCVTQVEQNEKHKAEAAVAPPVQARATERRRA